MLTDPISDFLIQIQNGYLAHKDKIVVTHSKTKEALARLLSKEGYLGDISIGTVDKTKKNITIVLKYEEKRPKITKIVRVSKPGRRVYVDKNQIPKVLGGLGTAIISTSIGFLTNKEARKKSIGGEVICKLW